MMSELQFQRQLCQKLKSNHVKCCDKQNIRPFRGNIPGGQQSNQTYQTNISQAKWTNRLRKVPIYSPYSGHIRLNVPARSAFALFVLLLSEMRCFYIIINQFDTFTRALKRECSRICCPKMPSIFVAFALFA